MRRQGFTLIELMVVIVIIGILVAIMLPAIRGAFTRGREAQMQSEVSQIETALANFKSNYGLYPPSQITLYENWIWNEPSPPPPNLIRSRALIRRMWPQFDFNRRRDLNQDGETNGAFDLNGQECLVFFLAGMVQDKHAIGFSKNPRDPLSVRSQNRTSPFYRFKPKRLRPGDTDSLVEWTYGAEDGGEGYVYLSSYSGRGYRVSDAIACGMEHHYYSTEENVKAAGTLDHSDETRPGLAYNSDTFQLILPGFDGRVGLGGLWYPRDQHTGSEPYPLNVSREVDGRTVYPRRVERDNVTNFASGMLDDY